MVSSGFECNGCAIAWPSATASPEGAVKPTGGRLIQKHFKIVFCREICVLSIFQFGKGVSI